MSGMPVVYVAHPVSGDVGGNLRKATRWVRWAAVTMGVAPVAPYIEMCLAMDDDNPEERAIGMRADHAILAKCDEVWLCGPHVSAGMSGERKLAESLGIPVHRYTAMVGVREATLREAITSPPTEAPSDTTGEPR